MLHSNGVCASMCAIRLIKSDTAPRRVPDFWYDVITSPEMGSRRRAAVANFDQANRAHRSTNTVRVGAWIEKKFRAQSLPQRLAVSRLHFHHRKFDEQPSFIERHETSEISPSLNTNTSMACTDSRMPVWRDAAQRPDMRPRGRVDDCDFVSF